MTAYVQDVARRALVRAGEAPAEGDWELDDFFAAAAGRMVKGAHVAIFEAAVGVRQSIRELSGPREALVAIVEDLREPILRSAERLTQIEPDLARYLKAIVACDNVAIPEGRTLFAWGDEKRVPGGTELAAEVLELQKVVRRAAELSQSVDRRLDERRPDILRAKMLTPLKGDRPAMISALDDLGFGPTEIAEALSEAPPPPTTRRDRRATKELPVFTPMEPLPGRVFQPHGAS